ncbi:unnamed protein product [Rhizoctonia solani]|uniref:Protein kinase domain-containing protein n=1 Tax=Rhizoctonia solani TaxID=456999 RepID=A0A8H2XAF0_9AGAM|nr:unnamed protein product [Rhizoctonia solani]
MCAEIADAVTHLHSCGIVHGDIKGANIVVSDDHTLKLVDFGTSFTSQYSLQFSGGAQSGATFTIRYTAPEIILEKSKHTMAGDVYGLGMTMLEVTTGLTPYYGVNEAAVLRRIVDGISPTQPEQFMPNDQAQANNLWALITRCWRPEPDDRPSAAEVADNMWDINLALNYGTIVSTMNLDEILTRLNLHGCKVTTNISNDFDQLLDKTPSDNVCCSTLNGKKVAIKCPKLNGSNRTLQDLAHELFVWSRCNHPNILTCMGATSLRGELAMVSPWLQNGSLLDYLARTPRRNRIKLVYELTEAVSYLRSKNIVHGDITIFNILVSDDHTLKLCGFNHARVIAYNNLQFPGLHTPKEEEVPELSFKVDRVAAVTTGLEILVGVPLSQTETQLVLQNAWVRELVQQEFWGNTLKEIHDKILRIKSRANQRKKLQPGNPPSKLRAATLLTILPSFVAVSFALLQWKEKQPSEQIALAQTALGGLLWMLWG